MERSIDILIKGGTVYDGAGSEPFEAEIGISGDRIAFINKLPASSSQLLRVKPSKVIDAKNMAVAPGFIDTHAHSEFTLLADPRAEGKICQGITTEINGNCGLSAAPLYGQALKYREKELEELGIHEHWSSLGEYFEILGNRNPALNFVTLAGHGNIRACVIGYADRKPDKTETNRMKALLVKTINEGAIGLSTGLIYPPGVYSETEELIELCKALSQCCKNITSVKSPLPPFAKKREDGIINKSFIYTSHMRSEGDALLESIEEILKIGRQSGIKVHISHIKTSGKENWHKIDKAVSSIEEAREEGISITCDRYPYTAAATDLDTILPSWAYEGGAEEELKRLKSPELREKIRREILYRHPETQYWESVYVSSASTGKNSWMEGKSIAWISDRENSEPLDILFRILIEEELRVGAIFSSMSEDNLKKFLLLPYVMIGTDSSARSSNGYTHKGKPHPRGFGSFPRFLGKYVRDGGLMNMSDAIHKITMLPAETFGISGRGVIRKDAFADIVIFDHKEIIDMATFDEPFLKPEGIYYVFINGLPAVWEGRQTGIRSGRILK